jgi:hypothetical protein
MDLEEPEEPEDEPEGPGEPYVYPYKGLPLTPAIIGELATLLFAGNVRRQVVSDTVAKYHADHGGAPSNAMDVARQTKRALAMLAKAGRVEATKGYGIWRFPDAGVPAPLAADSAAEIDSEDQVPPHSFEVERQVGKGSQSLYAYSFPSDRRVAELEARDSWSVKIGHSKSPDPKARVKDQLGASNSHWPVIHLVINTDDAKGLEDFLHFWLKENERQLQGRPGSEWFDTSPNMIMAFLQGAFPGKFNDEAE